MKWRNWLSALIGVWFIVAPWVLGLTGHAAIVWTTVIAGIIQAGASAWLAMVSDDQRGWKTWQSWVSLVMGVWFVVQPFALSLTHRPDVTWIGVILGLVTILLQLWEMGAHDSSSPGTSSGSKASV